MKILSLTLHGFKHLELSRISQIHITPVNRTQLILGTNGSGKSSLMKELSPLPATPSEYTSDGKKIIEISHRGHLYVLTSDFTVPGNSFTITKDGEELNAGAKTVTTYRDLVAREFGITPDIHKLLTSSVRFTRMSTADRRQWFTRISDCDYTFALKYHKRLSQLARDVQGALKMNHARLVQESSKLISPEEEVSMRADILHLSTILQELIQRKSHTSIDYRSWFTQFELLESELIDISQRVIRAYTQQSKYTRFGSLAEAVEHKDITLTRRGAVETDIARVSKLAIDLEHQISTMAAQIDKNTALSSIDAEQELSKIAALSRNIVHGIEFEQPVECYRSLNALIPDFSALMIRLAEVPELPDGVTVSTLYDSAQVLSTDIVRVSDLIQKQVLQCKELEYHKTHGAVTCPACSHGFHKGYNDKTHEHTLRSLSENRTVLAKLEAEVAGLQPHLQAVDMLNRLRDEYRTLTQYHPMLKPLWSAIWALTEHTKHRYRKMSDIVMEVCEDLKLQVQMAQLQSKVDERLKMVEVSAGDAAAQLTELRHLYGEAQIQLSSYASEMVSIRATIIDITTYIAISQQVLDGGNQISVLLDKYHSESDKGAELIRTECINDLILIISKELSKKEILISRIDIQKALVDEYTKNVEELKSQSALLQKAVKAMSPTEGLIARGLVGFMNHFLSHVNGVIARIWSYPLEVIPISIEGETDVDYKFPIRVNNGRPIADISLGSTAIMEVIDFAFMVTAMKFLRIDDYPLYLDELGTGMDHVHRESIFRAIHDLVDSGNHSQVFMVSHYESCYGCLTNTDITVLCSKNIALPKNGVFNQHTTIMTS